MVTSGPKSTWSLPMSHLGSVAYENLAGFNQARIESLRYLLAQFGQAPVRRRSRCIFRASRDPPPLQ